MRHALTALACVAVASCGGSREAEKPARADGAVCDDAAAQLGERLGPELSAVLNKVSVADPTPVVGEDQPPRPPLGCALVYTLVAEEFAAEDLPADEVNDAGLDQQLAFGVPDAQGKVTLHTAEPSPKAPGAVMLSLEVRDVLDDGRPTLVVQQDQTSGGESWRGLRIFSFPGEGRAPREILDEELKVKTPEGLELVAQWQSGNVGGRRAVIVEGAGAKVIYTWQADAQRFQFDEQATADHNPKPPAPASEGAPSSEDAPPAGKIPLP